MSFAFPTNNVATLNALFAVTIPLGVLYALSFVVTLSSRKRIRRRLAGAGAVSLVSRPSIRMHGPPGLGLGGDLGALTPGASDVDEKAEEDEPATSKTSFLLSVPKRLARAARSLSPPAFRPPRPGAAAASPTQGVGVSVSVYTDVRTEWDEPVAGGERRGSGVSDHGARLGLSMLSSGTTSVASVSGGRQVSFRDTLSAPAMAVGNVRRESWQD